MHEGHGSVSQVIEHKWRNVMVEPFGVISYDVDGGLVFALKGELDACTCRGLAERLTGPPGSLLVVDLFQLSFMDSSGLGAIHAARQMAIKQGGNLVVCRPGPMVFRVLQITGLDMWITEMGSGLVEVATSRVQRLQPDERFRVIGAGALVVSIIVFAGGPSSP